MQFVYLKKNEKILHVPQYPLCVIKRRWRHRITLPEYNYAKKDTQHILLLYFEVFCLKISSFNLSNRRTLRFTVPFHHFQECFKYSSALLCSLLIILFIKMFIFAHSKEKRRISAI